MLKRGTRSRIGFRIVLFMIALVGLLWFLVPLSLSVSLNLGNATGIAVCLLLGVYAIRMPRVHHLLRRWEAFPGAGRCDTAGNRGGISYCRDGLHDIRGKQKTT